ncbi:GyrI-like domain-containing protein [Shewanella salipaludis]|uniref:GyrI-like domain-containing protein n=1 Tax=Shewanella salipaludis TaxID=2723052 RepID=A0A972JIV9_9GAMM|nr:GyrI-like domain-containing protein [Shewanella salipaludis]NMH64475.1 GyrI-like domain-containing protein [Shewanella salipaludis]
MKLIHLDDKQIHGLKVRTNNAAEMQPASGKIGPLWQQFHARYGSRLNAGTPVYGVYHEYQSDMHADFSVLAGTTADSLAAASADNAMAEVTLVAGDYLQFSAEGEMPGSVIDLWGRVWAYFASADCPYRRRYLTDFECYPNDSRVEICIGVVG